MWNFANETSMFYFPFYIFSFSNESGFVSVGHPEMSAEHNFSAFSSHHHYSSQTERYTDNILHDKHSYITHLKTTVTFVKCFSF